MWIETKETEFRNLENKKGYYFLGDNPYHAGPTVFLAVMRKAPQPDWYCCHDPSEREARGVFTLQKEKNREKESKVSVHRNILQIWTRDKTLAQRHLTPVDVLTIKTGV